MNKIKPSTLAFVCALGLVAGLAAGCQTIYNSTMESVFGYEKRELLKKAVVSLQKEQQQAQVEFKDAMTRLKELYAFDGGDLEKVYNKLKSAYDDCNDQAADVHKRIENMEGTAQSMFAEWEKEIQQFSNPTFAANSRKQLQETKERYAQLSRAVRASEDTMKPVLAQLKDHVLFLKHNLNAAAIGSLKGEAANIQAQIEGLITRMNASIAEADAFIKTLPAK
jgi:DNA-binding ferritin-like protein